MSFLTESPFEEQNFPWTPRCEIYDSVGLLSGVRFSRAVMFKGNRQRIFCVQGRGAPLIT